MQHCFKCCVRQRTLCANMTVSCKESPAWWQNPPCKTRELQKSKKCSTCLCMMSREKLLRQNTAQTRIKRYVGMLVTWINVALHWLLLTAVIIIAKFWHLNNIEASWGQLLSAALESGRLCKMLCDSGWYFPSREGTWGHFVNPFFPLTDQGWNKPPLYKSMYEVLAFHYSLRSCKQIICTVTEKEYWQISVFYCLQCLLCLLCVFLSFGKRNEEIISAASLIIYACQWLHL